MNLTSIIGGFLVGFIWGNLNFYYIVAKPLLRLRKELNLNEKNYKKISLKYIPFLRIILCFLTIYIALLFNFSLIALTLGLTLSCLLPISCLIIYSLFKNSKKSSSSSLLEV
jgi:amino acid transporter